MAKHESCEAIEPLLAPYSEPHCAELTAADRARVDAHLDACPSCRHAAGRCEAAHAALRACAHDLTDHAPALLSARCRAVAARASSPRRATRWVGWSAAAATAAVVLFIFLMPTQAVATQLAADHLKCAKFNASAHKGTPGELETVWRNRRQQKISVPDGNAAHSLRLVGLRRCISTDGNMAHVMYERAGQPVSLFVLGDDSLSSGAAGRSSEVEALGHKAILWTSGPATYVLVGRDDDLAGVSAWMKNEVERRRTTN